MYKKTQYGSWLIIILLILLGFLVFLMLKMLHQNITAFHISFIVTILFILILLLFFRLTIKIENETLIASFGINLIKFRFNIKDIENFNKVRNHWYYGFGIRLTPHGWLYNISGLDAVEIKMKSGKKYRIGTNDPDGLLNALNNLIKK